MSRVVSLKCDACPSTLLYNLREPPPKEAAAWSSVRMSPILRTRHDDEDPTVHACSDDCLAKLLDALRTGIEGLT